MKRKKPLTMTRKAIAYMKSEVTWKSIVIFAATCTDEFDWTEEDIEAFAVRLERYAGAVDEHVITLRKVTDIIKRTIGIEFKGF